MRVLFLTQGARTPSSRFRVQQFVPRFEAHGIQCRVLAPTPSAQGELPSRNLPPLIRHVLRPASVPSRLFQFGAIKDADVVVIQKPLFNYPGLGLEPWVARRKPTAFDIDDALFHRMGGLMEPKLRRIGETCHALVVGNSYLADWFARPEKTTLIPTVVDVERYRVRPDPDGPFTLGWTGVSSNLGELRPWVGALKRALDAVKGRLLIVAERLSARWLHKLAVDFVPWSLENELAALDRMHVGLMPLADTPFNRGKCGFKLLQYQARGIPVVASPVGVNATVIRVGETGLLVDDDDSLFAAIVQLAGDRARRIELGQCGRAHVEAHYSVDAVLPQWLELLHRLNEGRT